MDVLKQIDERGITSIVINHSPQFSSPLPPAAEDSLVRRFPETKRFGPLEVRWQP
jgi:hypothetical protein